MPEPVECLNSSDILASQPQPFLAGRDAELKAVESFIRFVMSTATESAILVFGWPGTGKTVFPRALAFRLNQSGFRCAMVRISCQSLTATLSVDEVRERLRSVEDFVAQSLEPKIIVFSELDALAPRRADNPTLLLLSTWVMDFLDVKDPRLMNSVIIGITNNPGNVDPAVIDRLPCILYFALPSKTTIAAILGHENIPEAAEVADHLLSRVGREGFRLTPRGVFKAAKLALTYYASKSTDIRTLRHDLIADFMAPFANVVSQEEIDNYENRYQFLIRRAQKFADFWSTHAPVQVPVQVGTN